MKRLFMQFNNWSIRRKLTLSCWGAIVIPLLLIFMVISVIYVRMVRSTFHEQIQITLNKTTDEINTWFQQNEEKLLSIATDISVQKEMINYTKMDYKSRLEFRDFIRNRLANVATSDQRVVNIYIYINKEKKSFSNDYSDKDLALYYNKEEWFQQLTSGNKKQILQKTKSIQTGEDVIFAAIPISSVMDGSFIGFIYSELDYTKILNAFYPLVLNSKNAILIDGTMIATDYNENSDYMSVYSEISPTNQKVEYIVSLENIKDAYKMALLYFILGMLALMITIYFTNRLFMKWFTKRIIYLKDTLLLIAGGNLELRVKDDYHDEFGELSNSLNTMVHDMKQLIHENYIVQIENQKATLKALQSQINPHFIYNTLETISMLALIQDNYEIVDLTKAFSDMMRYAMNVSESEVLVQQEVENARNYIAIQKIRFGDSFLAEFNVEEKSKASKMLRLCLQPLIENSIKHGFSEFERQGYLKVSIKIKRNYLCIQVYNNGKHIEAERLELLRQYLHSESEDQPYECYAMRNLHRRLKLTYDNNFKFTIQTKEGIGTMTSIQIPILEV